MHQAVRERLARLHRERDRRFADRLLRIAKDCAAKVVDRRARITKRPQFSSENAVGF